MPTTPPAWETAVIGGGPAGLTGATYLARFRRGVVLVDAGRSRARGIPRSHNYPGFPHGVAGDALLRAMCEQMQAYPVERIDNCVDTLERGDDGFVLQLEGGRRIAAQRVLLATGASDIWPDLPEAAQALRDGVLRFCPVCDGFEASDRPVGVLTNGSAGVHEALYLRHFTDDVTVFLCDATVVLTPDELAQARDAGIRIAQAHPRAFGLRDDGVVVHCGEGEERVSALYCAFGLAVHSRLATALGAACDAHGYLVVDEHQQTSVPGLYAAGDVASGLNQISVAAGGAAIAASAMHVSLGRAMR